jgi:hypothetical protein
MGKLMGFDVALERQAEDRAHRMEKTMSVSSFDTQVSASSTSGLSLATSTPEVKSAQSMTALNGQSPANVSFLSQESQGGPVFGGYSSSAAGQRGADHVLRHPSAPATQGLMAAVKHWMGPWFPGHRPPCGNPPPRPNPGCGNPPPRPNPGCGNPPPRPNPGCGNPPPRPHPTVCKPYPTPPCGPDPYYSRKNNEELAKELHRNFDAFRDPRNPGFVSVDSIRAMAEKGWSRDPATNANIRLAKELLRRPDLMSALDRNPSTGSLDGLINVKNVRDVIKGDNYFKYDSDKQLAAEMLTHFNQLKYDPRAPELSFRDLQRRASQPLTGNAAQDHLTHLALEILKRTDVLKKMDNVAGRDNDRRISWQALYQLSR